MAKSPRSLDRRSALRRMIRYTLRLQRIVRDFADLPVCGNYDGLSVDDGGTGIGWSDVVIQQVNAVASVCKPDGQKIAFSTAVSDNRDLFSVKQPAV